MISDQLPTIPLSLPAPEISPGIAVAAFIEAKAAKGLSPRTLERYAWILDRFAKSFDVLPTSPGPVEDFLRSYGGGSDETLASRYRVVRTMYRWLVKRRALALEHDPFEQIEMPTVSPKIAPILNYATLDRLLRLTKTGRTRLLLVLLLATGLRIGECVGLRRRDTIDNTLVVAGKTGQRVLPLLPEVVALMRDVAGGDDAYLFCKYVREGNGWRPVYDVPATRYALGLAVRRAMRRAGVKGPKAGPHTLRHTFATRFIDDGGDVFTLKRILGHKRISSTERYVNQSVESIRDDYEAHALLRQIMRVPSPRVEDLPDLELPPEAIATPLYELGELVTLFLTPDKRNGHLYWCVRARCGAGRGRNWRVANLGVDLPVHAIDAYRLAAEIENGARRRAFMDQAAERRRI